jgi:hypothetical protein
VTERTSKLQTLQGRVDILEARLAIIQLEAEYARSWDFGDGEAWAGLFTDDGVFEIGPVGDRPCTQVKGSVELATYCRAFSAHTSGLHLMHLPRLVIEGDQAKGDLYFEFRFQRSLEPPESILGTTTGYYEIDYRLTPKGWRMLRRVEHPVARDNRTFYAL